jgi:hypothetical protein
LAALNSELEESLKEKNTEKEYLDDLSNELELMDDDDLLRYSKLLKQDTRLGTHSYHFPSKRFVNGWKPILKLAMLQSRN